MAPGLDVPGEAAIAEAHAAGWLCIAASAPGGSALRELDEGESSCIRIALAHSGPAILLMDEHPGRQIALELGLKVAVPRR